jgi:autotransporter-associated beta strand protein
LTAGTLGGLTGPGTLGLANTSAAVALSAGNNNVSTTFSGMLQGTGSLTKIGSGVLALSGSNTYTGSTTINQGSLVVDGWLTTSAVSVNGGTLGGTGSLPNVTVYAGGHVAPGDLNAGELVLAGNMDFEGGELDVVGDGSSLTSLSIAGSLILNAPMLDVSGSLAPGTYTIASYGGTLSGEFSAQNIPAGDTVSYGTGSDSSITLSVVPEPSTFALLGAGVLGLIGWVWRQGRRSIRTYSRRRQMYDKTIMSGLMAVASVAFAVSTQASTINVFNMPSGDTSLQFVTVGNPGNTPDTVVEITDGSTGYGSVPYVYQMGEYDVTTAQYCQFLNAVATAADPYGLYNPGMANPPSVPTTQRVGCGIIQTPITGGYYYSVVPGDENYPVNFVSWGDAARFCNWLQDGQPSGLGEVAGTTETGAYTLNGGTSDAAFSTVTRNANATYFIPSVNEWYKAAYYDTTLNGGTGGYWAYPTKSNTAPNNTLPDTGNHANFYDDINSGNGGYTDPTTFLTPVGDFVLSPSPYGTFDMGGDVLEWIEGAEGGSWRPLRGGAFDLEAHAMASNYYWAIDATYENGDVGFRVASSVPEPGSIALLLAGAVALGIWRLRRKA